MSYKSSKKYGYDDSRSLRGKRKAMFDERGKLINGVCLGYEKGFGYTQNPMLGSYCIDDNKLIYVLGKQILLYDTLAETQQSVDVVEEAEEITCLRFFKSIILQNHILYAVNALSKSYPTVLLRNFSKHTLQKYVLVHLEKDERIEGLELINDYKHIAVLSSLDGVYRLTLVDLLSKEIYYKEVLDIKVKGMFVPHHNSKQLLLYNDEDLYILLFDSDPKLLPLNFPKLQQDNIVSAVSSCTHQPTLYLITKQGNFIILSLAKTTITKHEVRSLGTYTTLNCEGDTVVCAKKPSAICCSQYHILIGYHHCQELTLIKISSLISNNAFESIPFRCPYLHKIVSMNFAYETMAVSVVVQVKEQDRTGLTIPIESHYERNNAMGGNALHHNQPQGKIFPVILNLLLHDTLAETLRSPIQSLLISTLFTHTILDVAVIPTKRLFLVLSAQNKIKAIRYEHIASMSFERMLDWEMSFHSGDTPLSLDVHPLMLTVAVGLKEGLKLFVISAEGLKPLNLQFPLKNCQSVRYSKFGHKLIVGSLNQIVVLHPYENKIIHTIQLGSGYCIKELSFLDKDVYIFAQGNNGSSTVLSSEGMKIFEVWQKHSKCICSAYDNIYDIAVVSYSESVTKFYRDKGSQQYAVMWTFPYVITQVLICNELNTIFMGTSLGKIRCYQWPFVDMTKFSKSFTEIQAHGAAVVSLKLTHDCTLLLSGAEDGSVYILKVQSYGDGILAADAQISIRNNSKSFKTLYYMQNYVNTTAVIENTLDEVEGQYESNKLDFDGEYNEIISNMQTIINERIKKEEILITLQLRKELEPLELQLNQLNQNKNNIKEQFNKLKTNCLQQEQQLENNKLKLIKEQYKITDQLLREKSQVELQNVKLFQITRLQCISKAEAQLEQYRQKEEAMKKKCDELQSSHQQSIITYRELIKEDAIESDIYKGKMMEQLEQSLSQQHENGQILRKKNNKGIHDIECFEDKIKHFQQLSTEMQIDIDNSKSRKEELMRRQLHLSQLLDQKDKVIFQSEKAVKELLSSNITTYTHQTYLKHNKQELIQKEKIFTNQLVVLNSRYQQFQEDFALASNQSKKLNQEINAAIANIQVLKQKQYTLKSNAFLKKYKSGEVFKKVQELFLANQNLKQFEEKIKQMFQGEEKGEQNITQQDAEGTLDTSVGRREQAIKKVVNHNNLRKIDDQIRKTIMVKLDRETVQLTCEVNELRKQKKKLWSKVKDLQCDIKKLGSLKENLHELVPANISIIQGNKLPSVHKPLPFELYHSQKSFVRNSLFKNFDQSTQLPSLIKNSISNNSISHDSSLFGVAEIQDQIAS